MSTFHDSELMAYIENVCIIKRRFVYSYIVVSVEAKITEAKRVSVYPVCWWSVCLRLKGPPDRAAAAHQIEFFFYLDILPISPLIFIGVKKCEIWPRFSTKFAIATVSKWSKIPGIQNEAIF